MRVRYYQPQLTKNARQLRKNQSEAEKLLWSKLRNRQVSNLKFQRQFQIESYIVDFVCREHRLIVELDGGQHNEELAKVYDNKRTETLKQLGYNVIRFWNNDVMSNIDGVLEAIIKEGNSHPNLLSKREGK